MAFTRNQEVPAFNDTSGTVLTAVMTGATAGRLHVVCSAYDGAATTTTITDTVGTVYAQAAHIDGSGGSTAGVTIHWGVAAGTGANTVTQTLGAARGARTIAVSEYTSDDQVPTLGKATQGQHSAANAVLGPLEVLTTGELGVAIVGNDTGATSAAAGGWSERMEPGTSDTQIQDFISPSLGNLSATWTNANDVYSMAFALFRSVALGSPPPAAQGASVGSTRSIFRAPARTWG